MAAFPVRIVHQIVITVVLLLWLWRRGLPSSPLTIPLVMSGIAVVLSIPDAIDPRMALENAWHWITNALLMLMFIDWTRRGADLMRAHLWTGGALVGFAAIEYLSNLGVRPSSLFILTNLTGAYAALLVVPALARRNYIVAIGGASLVLVNSSRGSMLALGVSLAVYAVLSGWINRRWLMIGGAALAALVIGISTQAGRITGDQHRLDIWRSAVEMTIDDPLHGVGVGLFGQAYRVYRDPLRTEDYTGGAHNLLLNTLAETGVIGAASGVLTVLVFLKRVSKRRSRLQNAALAALLGAGVHSMFDGFTATNYAVLVMSLAALLVSDAQAVIPARMWRVARAAAFGAVLLYIPALARFDVAQYFYEASFLSRPRVLAQIAADIDTLKLYDIRRADLLNGQPVLVDSTLTDGVDRIEYGLTNFGRLWR